jgi:hypothetical protein
MDEAGWAGRWTGAALALALLICAAQARAQTLPEEDIEQMDLASMLDTPLEVWAAT